MALTCACAAALAGCSSTGEPQHFVRDTLEKILPFVPDRIDPRYSALVRAGAPAMRASEDTTGREMMLRRATRLPEGAVLWLAADGTGFTFQDGILVATRGLKADLMSSDVSDLAALLSAGQGGTAERFHTHLGGEGQVLLESYVCIVSLRGRTAHEDCAGPDVAFTNTYSIAPGARAVAALRQHPRAGAGAWRFQATR